MKFDALSKYVQLRKKLIAEKTKYETRLAAINAALEGQKVQRGVKVKKRRKMSAAGRKRIAAAQKERWAKLKAAKK